jgi:hypothetical protein
MSDDSNETAAGAWLSALDTGFAANTPAKPFVCSYPGCSKTFPRASLRQSHIKVAHVNVRYVCIECGEPFESMDDLKNHEDFSHPGLEYWECRPCTNIRSGCACGRRFPTREALHKHQRSFIASDPSSPTGVSKQSPDHTVSLQTALEDVAGLGLASAVASPDEAHLEPSDHVVPLEFAKRRLMAPINLDSNTPRTYLARQAADRGSSISTFFVVDRQGATQTKSS